MSTSQRQIPEKPEGEMVIRTIALPKDTNSNGDIFGGWLLSQMDLGGGIASKQVTGGRVTTVAIDGMRFWNPVQVGDTVCCYAKLLKIGTTSVSFEITAWATTVQRNERRCVTQATFTYVAINADGRPVTIKK